jgi:ADP-heptose:LPS heptosyltransferase
MRFDVSIDPQSLSKSAALGWLSQIPRRIGFARGIGREFAPLLNNCRVRPTSEHLVDRSLELLKPLGISAPRVDFQLPRYPAAAERMATFLERATGNAFMAINPGAGWPSKVWPAERYGAVAHHVGEKWSLPSVVVWSGEKEHRWARTIVAQSQGHAVLAPSTNLQELTELLRQAQLFVGSDTGPLHMAAAVGTPSVSMYGPTRPANCGPYGAQHIALQEYYQEGTSRERRKADNEAMRAIDDKSVCSACDAILKRPKRLVAAHRTDVGVGPIADWHGPQEGNVTPLSARAA